MLAYLKISGKYWNVMKSSNYVKKVVKLSIKILQAHKLSPKYISLLTAFLPFLPSSPINRIQVSNRKMR